MRCTAHAHVSLHACVCTRTSCITRLPLCLHFFGGGVKFPKQDKFNFTPRSLESLRTIPAAFFMNDGAFFGRFLLRICVLCATNLHEVLLRKRQTGGGAKTFHVGVPCTALRVHRSRNEITHRAQWALSSMSQRDFDSRTTSIPRSWSRTRRVRNVCACILRLCKNKIGGGNRIPKEAMNATFGAPTEERGSFL